MQLVIRFANGGFMTLPLGENEDFKSFKGYRVVEMELKEDGKPSAPAGVFTPTDWHAQHTVESLLKMYWDEQDENAYKAAKVIAKRHRIDEHDFEMLVSATAPME